MWIVSSYYWIKKCLLSLPTQMSLHRYMFQVDVANWKQRMFFFERDAALNNAKKCSVILLMVPARRGHI